MDAYLLRGDSPSSPRKMLPCQTCTSRKKEAHLPMLPDPHILINKDPQCNHARHRGTRGSLSLSHFRITYGDGRVNPWRWGPANKNRPYAAGVMALYSILMCVTFQIGPRLQTCRGIRWDKITMIMIQTPHMMNEAASGTPQDLYIPEGTYRCY